MAEKKLPDIAIFDFDDTLVYSDTLLIFLSALIGNFRSKFYLTKSIISGLVLWGLHGFSKTHDFRTDIKKKWLKASINHIPTSQIKPAVQILIERTKWKTDILYLLKQHIEKGDKIVIATGALDIYILDLLESLKSKLKIQFDYAYIICTKAEIKHHKLTGQLAEANTVRETKKELIQAFLKKTPHHKTYGYGNAPNDLPFLNLCDYQMII